MSILKNKGIKLVLDFDSTFVKKEGLEELAAAVLATEAKKDDILSEISRITKLGMEGRISFTDSLRLRLAALRAHRDQVLALGEKLRLEVSDSIERNKKFFAENRENILVVSGGFRDFMRPVLADFHFLPENVFANDFLYDRDGYVAGFDEDNPLSRSGGKVNQLASLRLADLIYVLGDGYTDYEIREAGVAEKFFAFTENITRPRISKLADDVVVDFDDFLSRWLV